MMSKDYNWRGGRVTFWNLDWVQAGFTPKDHIDDLREDLAQVLFGNNTLLDVGWYPESHEAGCFVVQLIANEAWDRPVLVERSGTYEDLHESMLRAIDAACGRP